MPLDIQKEHLKIVKNILKQHVPHCEVWAFGSRVKGLAKKTSDLDLCILNSEPLSLEILSAIRDAFSLSFIPYKVDVLDWASIQPSFQENIAKEHIVLCCGDESVK